MGQISGIPACQISNREAILRQNSTGNVTTDAGGTVGVNCPVFGQFVQPVAKLVYRYVYRPRDGSLGDLIGFTDVENEFLVAKLFEMCNVDRAVEYVRRGISGHINRIFSTAIRGCIGKLQFL